jgi:hypothetical protein
LISRPVVSVSSATSRAETSGAVAELAAITDELAFIESSISASNYGIISFLSNHFESKQLFHPDNSAVKVRIGNRIA